MESSMEWLVDTFLVSAIFGNATVNIDTVA